MVPAMRYVSSSLIACFTVFITVCMTVSLSSSQCPTVTPPTCSCSTDESDYILYCPGFKVVVVSIGIAIVCSNNDVNDYSVLNIMRFGKVPVFGLMECQLPSVPLSRLMEDIGVRLDYAYVLYLKNPTNLHKDTFIDFPSLVGIGLEYDNNVVLPKSTFASVPQLEKLQLVSNNLSYLEPGVFRNLSQLVKLSLSGNFRNLSRAVFSDVHDLLQLHITFNKMTDLQPDTFADLIQLQEIYLDQNEFLMLPQDIFINKPGLRTVSLKNNKRSLETLPPRLLINLTTLNEVILTGCDISGLPEDLLWGSTGIRIISLHNNSLTTLPEQLFRDCRELEELDLSFNRIIVLHEKIFSNTRNLRNLNLSNNRLMNITDNIFSSLLYLEVLNMEYNLLSHIGADTCYHLRSLTSINLSNNMLTFENSSMLFNLSPLQKCIGLENIQLANNSITKVFDDWRYMISLKTLNLSHNKISRLEVAVIFAALSVCAAKQKEKEKPQEKRGLLTSGLASSTPIYHGNDILDGAFGNGFGDVTTASSVISSTPGKVAVTPTVASTVTPSVSIASSPYPGFHGSGLGSLESDFNAELGLAGLGGFGVTAAGGGAAGPGGVRISSGPVQVTTISRPIPIPYPHPVPVTITRRVPVPVPYPVPVEVPRPVPVPVPQPYPVVVPKPYPVEVPKPGPHPVPHPVPVSVPHPYPVAVPHTVSYPVVGSVAPSVAISPEFSHGGGYQVLNGFDGFHGFEGFDSLGLAGGYGDIHAPVVPHGGAASNVVKIKMKC